MAGEPAGALVAIETDVVDQNEGDHLSEEHMLAASIFTFVMLNVISLGIGQWLHSRHIYWLPECGATIIVGFIAGYVVSLNLPPDIERTETNLYFNPTFFTLFLLPPIIFEAGYMLNMSIFVRNIEEILGLAIFGTLIATAITWYALYSDYARTLNNALPSTATNSCFAWLDTPLVRASHFLGDTDAMANVREGNRHREKWYVCRTNRVRAALWFVERKRVAGVAGLSVGRSVPLGSRASTKN